MVPVTVAPIHQRGRNMAERDVIQEFMQKYGRIYEKFLNPEDQQFVMSNLNEEVERLRSHSRMDGTAEAGDRRKGFHAGRRTSPRRTELGRKIRRQNSKLPLGWEGAYRRVDDPVGGAELE